MKPTTTFLLLQPYFDVSFDYEREQTYRDQEKLLDDVGDALQRRFRLPPFFELSR